MKNKQLCSEPDCFGQIDKEDIIIRGDGTPHPTSLKCHNCISDQEWKRFKAYKKHRRNTLNKLQPKL